MSKSKLAKGQVYETEIPIVVESDHPLTKQEIKRIEKSLTGPWVFPISFDLPPFKAKH